MKNEIYGARIVDLALQIEENLIIADLHLGYENALINEGILVPKLQYKKITNRFDKIFQTANSYCNIKRIIVNGDLKHEFGKSWEGYEETIRFINFLKNYGCEIILIRGNHDNFVMTIAKNLEVKFCENFTVKKFLIFHGHKIPENFEEITKGIDTIIIGHEHPTVGLRTLERTEKMKCFLKGNFKGKNLIVIPAFNFITEGTDILQGELLSPFLNSYSIEDFEVFGVEDFEVFYFGKVKNLLNLNFV